MSDKQKTPPPSFALEQAFTDELGHGATIAGVDEVGRGPFAGPVLAAAAVLDEESAEALIALGVTDSKRIPKRKHSALAETLWRWSGPGEAHLSLGAASVHEIAELNILGATYLAMRRAIARLPMTPSGLLIDGARIPKDAPAPARAVVGGDRKSISIAAASLVAKAARDRLMTKLDAKWPGYSWSTNAGYGSAKHCEAILERGLTPHHRVKFCEKLLARSTEACETASK